MTCTHTRFITLWKHTHTLKPTPFDRFDMLTAGKLMAGSYTKEHTACRTGRRLER